MFVYMYIYIYIYTTCMDGCIPELDDSVMRVNLAVRITACGKWIIDRVSFNTVKRGIRIH